MEVFILTKAALGLKMVNKGSKTLQFSLKCNVIPLMQTPRIGQSLRAESKIQNTYIVTVWNLISILFSLKKLISLLALYSSKKAYYSVMGAKLAGGLTQKCYILRGIPKAHGDKQ